jgi:hypothetical protein
MDKHEKDGEETVKIENESLWIGMSKDNAD